MRLDADRKTLWAITNSAEKHEKTGGHRNNSKRFAKLIGNSTFKLMSVAYSNVKWNLSDVKFEQRIALLAQLLPPGSLGQQHHSTQALRKMHSIFYEVIRTKVRRFFRTVKPGI